jgi:isopentenyl diphosphate isomerase/L-lactate dehydrogenase-like FMN-dependent dehydrogenase
VVVSNHGGRSLDSSCAAIDALPDVVSAVGGKMTVLVDSGVRRGSDIVKAVALGAQGVLVGRAMLYGLGAGGEDGVVRALDLLRQETVRTMGMLGARNISEVDRSLLG